MEKTYTSKDYADKAVEANKLGQQLYICTHTIDVEVDVPDYDKDGNPVMIEVEEEITVIDYDEDGNPIGEHTEIIKKQVQKTHKETVQKDVEELIIAPHGYYICYKDNYTDGTLNPNYEQEAAARERQRLDALTLTPSDVERALYKAKQMDFEDLKTLISEQAPQLDMKALAIEFRANNFYRGVKVNGMRLIDTVGALLGYTSSDMDYLFEHKELPNNASTNN